jgi:beta-phosphoglucomutase
MPLRAIIFDFNGVIADDETIHVLAFQQALKEEGIALSKDDYYGTYMGMDERNCTIDLLTTLTGTRDQSRVQRIMDRKAALFMDIAGKHKPSLFPGVVEFVKEAGKRYSLAIASGGRRGQIDLALVDTPIHKDFAVIVSAEDTGVGKPDPAIYERTLKKLNATACSSTRILPGHCLVIEDSRAGIQSARSAGMKVIGLATTYPPDQLADADMVLLSLDGPVLPTCEKLFS